MRCLTLLLVVLWPISGLAEEVSRSIVVSAVGSATATPDMATVSLGVAREAKTAQEAMQEVSQATAAVLETVSQAGIEDRDVQTSSLTLNPVWDQGNTRPPAVRGYSAATMLSIRVRDLDILGGLLDAVVGEGANRLNGLFFGIAETDALEDAARADAVERARSKAETLAQAAGVELGAVQTISEGGGGSAPAPIMRGAAMEAASMPIASGELDIRVAVTVTFAIAD